MSFIYWKKSKKHSIRNRFNNYACKCDAFTFKHESRNVSLALFEREKLFYDKIIKPSEHLNPFPGFY